MINHKQYPLGRRGFPDLSIFLKNNKTLFVELKSKNGKLTNHQIKFKEIIINLNYEYIIITSLLELKDIINRYNI